MLNFVCTESLMDHETVVPKIVHQFERGTEVSECIIQDTHVYITLPYIGLP